MGWLLQSVLVGSESVAVLLTDRFRRLSRGARRTERTPDSGRGEEGGPVPPPFARCPWVFSRVPQHSNSGSHALGANWPQTSGGAEPDGSGHPHPRPAE
jgi:hypothetical protein